MILVHKKIICVLTQYAERFQAFFRKVFRVLSNNCVSTCHDCSRQHVSIVRIRNTFNRLKQIRRNLNHRFGKGLYHLLTPV